MAGKFASSAVGTIASGAILGGVGSELTGGNFWEGVVIGGVVTVFNHLAHKESTVVGDYDSNGVGPGPKKKSASKSINKKTIQKTQKIVKALNDINSTSDDAVGMAFEIGGKRIPSSIKPLGTFLGKANVGLSIGMGISDTIDFFSGDISGGRLGFNLSSYVTPIVVGSEFGAVPGFLTGSLFSTIDMSYQFLKNQINPILTRANTSNPYWIYNYKH